MQINKVNSGSPEITVKKSDKYTSFKGLGAVDSFSLGVANAIENGGLAVSFTLQDMLGTNLPRPVMGLMRNSKENEGKKNFGFAAKELVREMMTGPSMFLIPMGMLAAGKKLFGKTLSVPMKLIKSFGDIHAANPVDITGKSISKQEFYKNTFTEIIKNAKSETTPSEETLKKAAEFAEKLSNTDKSGLKNTISELSSEFIDIAKNHADDAAHTDFTRAVISENASAPFKETVEHMMSYADDVVAKATGNPDKNLIKKLTNNKVLSRLGAIATMYAAVMTFLQIIPKLYNKAEGKKNAGLKGLVKEETDSKDSDADTVKTNDSADKKSNGSAPSFGSSAAFVDKLTGSDLPGKIANGIEFAGPNVSFPLLLGIMGFGIVAPRIINAKDKYDKQEIIRRDVTTCAVMCFGEKALGKIFSKVNETNHGMVLAAKDKGFKDQSFFKKAFDYLRPVKGVNVMDTQQIVSKYSGIDKYKNGISGFCEFIDNQGGNLSKIFSLTDDSKNIVNSLLEKEGQNLASADNKTIKEILSEAKDSKEVQKLIELFKGTDKNTNPWIKKAQTLNARFTALSVLVLVPAFLGFFLPWINEKLTKKQINEESNNISNKKSPFEHSELFNKKIKTNSVFNDIKSN